MKATEQYFPVVLFIMLYKVVLTFESVDEILKCDHSNESYWAVLSCGTVYYAVQVVLTFKSMDEILKCDHVNKTYSSVLSCAIVQCITLYNMVLTFEFVDEIIPCAHKNESGISRWKCLFSSVPVRLHGNLFLIPVIPL